jgi:ferritin
MLTASVHDALNQQLSEELFSSNLYLSLSAFLD